MPEGEMRNCLATSTLCVVHPNVERPFRLSKEEGGDSKKKQKKNKRKTKEKQGGGVAISTRTTYVRDVRCGSQGFLC